MGRKSFTLDFGANFPLPAFRGGTDMNYDVISVTVSELNSYIKDKIAEDEALNALVVKGETSMSSSIFAIECKVMNPHVDST